MPVYDYRCTDCNSVYDVFHKGQEIKEDVVCPSCGSSNYKKLISAPMVSISSSSSSKNFNPPPCETGGCCNGGVCGLN